jgi:WD40 repeat protein
MVPSTITRAANSPPQVKRTEIKKLLSSRSDRVKAVDFHPTENWILCALYNGKVNIYNYDTQAILRTFPITDVPVRAGRFVARKNWIVTGSDDFQLVFLAPDMAADWGREYSITIHRRKLPVSRLIQSMVLGRSFLM